VVSDNVPYLEFHSSPFLNLLEERNISLFKPRKDQCDICCRYESGIIEKELYEQHIARKEEARQEKVKDKAEYVIKYTRGK
jgi:hypothetical protein